MLKSTLAYPLGRLDRLLAPLTPTAWENRRLFSLLFHCVFDDPRLIQRHVVDPAQCCTVSDLRNVIEYLLEHGYSFVAPRQLSDTLTRKPHAMITFDDGYANNIFALSVLRSFGVPAIIYVSTNYVRDAKGFWWDTIYQNRYRQNCSRARILAETTALKRKTVSEIQAYLTREFGSECEKPNGDLDRPMTSSELREVANDPLIEIGNHTADHAILTLYGPEVIHSQIRLAQDYIGKETGKAPISISYPNGNFNGQVLEIARAAGLLHGVTTRPHGDRLPVAPDKRMRTGRYYVASGSDLASELAVCRSAFQVYPRIRCLKNWAVSHMQDYSHKIKSGSVES